MDNVCEVCQETDFFIKSGHFFCRECLTQKQDFQEMINEFIEDKFIKETHLKKNKGYEKTELTTWEEYNYILLGLVNEVTALDMGSNRSLKITVLQLWTRYLQKVEAAFFATKSSSLPKLPIQYHQKDAKIIYNKKLRRKIVQRKHGTSRVTVKRRQVVQSEYNSFLASQGSINETILTSRSVSSKLSSVINIIPLQVTRKAMTILKKNMTKKHIQKHHQDLQKMLKCHRKLKLNTKRNQNNVEKPNQGILLAILYIGLNITENNIQISDLCRFLREGHISYYNVHHFFPENIVKGEKIKTTFTKKTWNIDNSVFRRDVFAVCKLLGVQLQIPNLITLCKRYITDLCLPKELIKFIERLIMFSPPIMPIHLSHRLGESPNYEGRAMAYIVFVMKLIFGLDGKREKLMSESASNLNKLIKEMNIDCNPLFVWSDWIKYIEMRTNILNSCHVPTAMQNKKINENNFQVYIENLNVYDNNIPRQWNKTNLAAKQLSDFLNIFEDIYNLHLCEDTEINLKQKCKFFKSSFTPNKSYLDELLKEDNGDIEVPTILQEDFSKRNISAFLKPKAMKNLFGRSGIDLIINENSYNDNCKKVPHYTRATKVVRPHNQYKFEFVDDENWIDLNESEYSKPKITTNTKKLKTYYYSNEDNCSKEVEINETYNNFSMEIDSLKSFDIFNENDMEPLNYNLNTPRHNLDKHKMFDDMSDDDDDICIKLEKHLIKKSTKFETTNFDYWIYLITEKSIHNKLFDEFEQKLPASFSWLLEKCAKFVEMKAYNLYSELCSIEVHYAFTLEPIDKMTTMILYNKQYEKVNNRSHLKRLKSEW